jgi:hypothetical protein
MSLTEALKALKTDKDVAARLDVQPHRRRDSCVDGASSSSLKHALNHFLVDKLPKCNTRSIRFLGENSRRRHSSVYGGSLLLLMFEGQTASRAFRQYTEKMANGHALHHLLATFIRYPKCSRWHCRITQTGPQDLSVTSAKTATSHATARVARKWSLRCGANAKPNPYL